MNIKIIELPVARWQEYKDLRLTMLKLYPQAYASSYEENLKLSDEKWRGYLQQAQKRERLLLFAEVDGKLVGSGGAHFYDKLKEAHKASIIGIGVLPDFQGQGIGRKLMAAILKEIESDPKIRKIDLDVNTIQQAAYQLYESLGFVKVGEFKRELMIEGKFHDLYEMEKLID